eukprot:5703467-Pyramimonas_sp.AAC.3
MLGAGGIESLSGLLGWLNRPLSRVLIPWRGHRSWPHAASAAPSLLAAPPVPFEPWIYSHVLRNNPEYNPPIHNTPCPLDPLYCDLHGDTVTVFRRDLPSSPSCTVACTVTLWHCDTVTVFRKDLPSVQRALYCDLYCDRSQCLRRLRAYPVWSTHQASGRSPDRRLALYLTARMIFVHLSGCSPHPAGPVWRSPRPYRA